MCAFLVSRRSIDTLEELVKVFCGYVLIELSVSLSTHFPALSPFGITPIAFASFPLN